MSDQVHVAFQIVHSMASYSEMSQSVDPTLGLDRVIADLLDSQKGQGFGGKDIPDDPTTVSVFVNRPPNNPAYLPGASQDQQRAFGQRKVDFPHRPVADSDLARPVQEVIDEYNTSYFTLYLPGTSNPV